MNPKVLSAVAVDIQRTEVWEIEMPEIPPDAGLLKLEAAGVCGSDWPAYSKKSSGPRILGHENVGTIAKIGAIAQKRWGAKEGDRVTYRRVVFQKQSHFAVLPRVAFFISTLLC